jgi:hypothetical protein
VVGGGGRFYKGRSVSYNYANNNPAKWAWGTQNFIEGPVEQQKRGARREAC